MDNDAIETFFRQHYAQAYGLAFSLLHDEEASRDVVADAFEQMMNLNHNDTEQKLTPCYLFTAVKNRSLNQLRRQQAENRYAQAVIRQYDTASFADDKVTAEWLERVERIMDALDELTPKTRQAMTACFVERKKYSEAAREMGISKNTVKKHIINGLRFLRMRFAPDE